MGQLRHALRVYPARLSGSLFVAICLHGCAGRAAHVARSRIGGLFASTACANRSGTRRRAAPPGDPRPASGPSGPRPGRRCRHPWRGSASPCGPRCPTSCPGHACATALASSPPQGRARRRRAKEADTNARLLLNRRGAPAGPASPAARSPPPRTGAPRWTVSPRSTRRSGRTRRRRTHASRPPGRR